MHLRRLLLMELLGSCILAGMMSAQSDSTRTSIEISGGMGISAFSAPSIVDYVNYVAQPVYAQRLSEFTTVTEFFASAEGRIAEEWGAGIEYGYVVKSYSVEGAGTTSQFNYSFHAPGLAVHYLMEGRGYELKVGGGLSYVVATFSQALYGNPSFQDFRANGASVNVDAIGNTMFDDHFFGTIAVDMRWVTGGAFKSGQQEARLGSTAAHLGAFMAGVKFGIMLRW